MKLVWSRAARTELIAADDYYTARDPAFADHLVDGARTASLFLVQHPLAGEAVDERQRRKWRIKGTPYLLLYRATGDELRVLHIVHSARDWHRFL